MTKLLKQKRVMQECQNFNIVQRTHVTYVKVCNVDIHVHKKFYNCSHQSLEVFTALSSTVPAVLESLRVCGVVAKSFALKKSLHMSCLWLCI